MESTSPHLINIHKNEYYQCYDEFERRLGVMSTVQIFEREIGVKYTNQIRDGGYVMLVEDMKKLQHAMIKYGMNVTTILAP